ncbi:hypothetical protein OXX79_000556 [Metschnikowia pulcherrima]
MIYRFVARQCRFTRQNSIAVLHPVLQQNTFSQKRPIESTLEIPQNTYPNPLYSYDKAQLLSLNIKQLKHLVTLPVKSPSEKDRFHMHIIEIFHENLIKDTKLAVLYLDLITDSTVRDTIFEHLRKFYQSDPLRLSLLEYVINPASEKARKLVLGNLHSMLKVPNEPKSAAAIAFSYITKLALTDRVNPESLLLYSNFSKVLYKHTPKDQWQQLYAAVLQTNIRFGNYHHYETVRDYLLQGSALDRFVARTGFLGAKWHHTEESNLPELHKKKMIHHFSISRLASFTQQAIRQRDITNGNMYLELLVSKFEVLNEPKHLQLVLSVMLSHSMTFKGPQECVSFLRYIIDSNLSVVPNTLLRILTALRLEKFYDEALLLVNYLHTEKLSATERGDLVAEIMKVITGKFSSHPKIAVAYYASLFNDEIDTALDILKDLMLLDLVYGPGAVNHDYSIIERADIHEDLKKSDMSHEVLRDMYAVTLRSLVHEQKTNPVLIKTLYEAYTTFLTIQRRNKNAKFVSGGRKADDSVIALFLDHLLRENPEARDDMNLVQDKFKFQTAKWIFKNYYGSLDSKQNIKDTYIFGLMITSALLKHQDLAFALRCFKKARDLSLPITFNQVYPLIMYHYSKAEMDKAQQWFTLLMQSGAEAKSVAADRVFDIAKEQKWPNTGTHYRNNVRVKKRLERDEVEKLKVDPLSGVKREYKDDSHAPNTNFCDELEKFLHELAVHKKQRALDIIKEAVGEPMGS